MLTFREFLNTAAPAPAGDAPKPPPDLINLANRAKQALTQAKSTVGSPAAPDKMKQLQQVGQELTSKNQQFQLQQYDTIANKILQTAQPLTGSR